MSYEVQNDEYYAVMESLFEHPGWKLLTADAQRQIHEIQANALDVYKSWDELNVARGRALQLYELTLLPEIVQGVRTSQEIDDADV
jgi:hypothetical protein